MFVGAIILNLFSSYFLASIFGNFLIIFIALFALIVLNMEILSLFGAINEINAFVFSIINFLATFSYFKFKKIKPLKFNFDLNRLKNSLLFDKSLIILSSAFLILLLISLFLALVMPVLEPDSQTYHFLRAYEFASQGSLNHFETNDIRALVMPINSEIIYSWLLLFKKNFHGYGIVSYCAFFLTIFSMWSVFEKFKFAFRKRLYAIFVFSSLCAIIIQMPSLQTDLLVGSFLISAFALYIRKSIYFSSLALALATGVKSTGVVAVFAFFVLIFLYEKLIEKNNKIENLKRFSLFFFINFFVFSSYNYILNLIHFHNPLSNHTAYLGHRFWGGIKGYIANLIHFSFQALDFTGFRWGVYLSAIILEAKKAFFGFIHIDPQIGCNVPQQIVNIFTDEQTVGFGILGFLVFLPLIFVSIFKFFFNKNKKTALLFILSLAFVINILMLARATAYMVYSIRFIVAFVCLSSVVLIGAYKKKFFLKPVILFFCLFYMFLIPFHNKRMPFKIIYDGFKKANYNLSQFEDDCYQKKVISVMEVAPRIFQTIKKRYPDKKNIAFVKTLVSSALYLKKLEYEGYNIDFLNVGTFSDEKMKKYDLIILEDTVQTDNVFNPEDIVKNYKIEGKNIIFNSNKNYNCYFVYADEMGAKLYEEDALERACFSFAYMKQRKNFKLDYKEEISMAEYDFKANLYYFINQIDY
ncbi:MAG: hypothetical protein IJB79_05350 [Candidatus Gastranaerophilales bacterium]|nr:hypothetical protein [Candidatus Gastranaerophilales bacterium]